MNPQRLISSRVFHHYSLVPPLEVPADDLVSRVPGWFERKDAAPSEPEITELRELLSRQPMRIWAFMGLWCADCERTIPELVHVLRKADFPVTGLRLLALGKEKKFFPWTAKYDIRRLPTLVLEVQKGSGWEEHGRMVEPPARTLLPDLVELLRATVHCIKDPA